MSIVAMREAVKGAYSGPAWKARVSKMSDEQIVAIYHNLKSQNKL